MTAEWIASSSLLILVVLLLRAVLGKRISAGLRYGLWAVVLVRLLVPASFFAWSVTATIPQLPTWTMPEAMQEESIYVLPVDVRPLEDSSMHVLEDGKLGDPNSFGYPKLTGDGETVVRYADKISPLELLGWIWTAGAAVMGVVLAAANLRFFSRLRRVRKPLEGTAAPIPVYVATRVPSPCLVGLLRPAVYVTEEAAANPTMLRHVLAHELTHYNHRDHLWSVLRGIALAVHWWNPLVWLAVACSRRDGELACDEGALEQLGDSERTAYGETLLALVTAKSKPGDLFCFATTMTGGKRSLKERIQRIACQPKRLVSAMVAVIAVLTLSTLVAFGQGKAAEEIDTPDSAPLPVETQFPDANAWQPPDIVLTEDGVPEMGYNVPGGVEILRGNPIPAPREWADPDTLESRKKATALEGLPIIWAELVSPSDGWLVACYGRGVAAADTYVYKTEDGGMNWIEVTMPGTSWHIADVEFLSPERLIVAQRFFDGAPCFITKDGGETWEEIELPDTQVLDISYSRGILTMWIGQGERDPATFSMTSTDLGDHWRTVSSEESYAEDHPDDVWSSLADLLERLTPENIGDISTQNEVTAEKLVELLQETSASRASRYHSYSTFEDEEAWMWSLAEWAVPLSNGGTLHLLACDSGSVEMSYETADGAVSAFFSQSQELCDLIIKVGQPYFKEVLPYDVDLDRDGSPDQLSLRSPHPSGGYFWSLECSLGSGSTWRGVASTSHPGWTSFYLCQVDNRDCLLEYTPYMGMGTATYTYKLFCLENGRETIIQENTVFFDINFGIVGDRDFDPWAISAFMDEINALLADSTLLLNTDSILAETFEREGRLYDSLFWLEDTRKEGATLLENLLIYHNRAVEEMGVPDISDLLANITKDGITSMSGTSIIKTADIANALNRVSGQVIVPRKGRGQETEAPRYEVLYHKEPYQCSIYLEAGGTADEVWLTIEGTAKAMFYSENPDNDATYLRDVPYTIVGIVDDAELWQLMMDHGAIMER